MDSEAGSAAVSVTVEGDTVVEDFVVREVVTQEEVESDTKEEVGSPEAVVVITELRHPTPLPDPAVVVAAEVSVGPRTGSMAQDPTAWVVVGMIEGMAHTTTDPRTVPAVAGITTTETATPAASPAAIASQSDPDTVGIPTETGPLGTATGTAAADGTTITEGGRDTTTEVDTTIPANEGTRSATSRKQSTMVCRVGISRPLPSSVVLLAFVRR